ncbi:thiol peroxidase [Vagococcus acidifermentans]|uniref:Lipid hydroperoxide peroxidase n=1 Tax=Vagococcus acidifermentans TaxID=564710 RepID=A0A430AQA8_9ENTE|nr:thiol peroxidase [Vagococcus acidifermentans]RSU10246.1 lipid hydroperoxide peroxidase [Vagococcus acidifermentans]
MNVTLKGKTVELEGVQPQINEKAPDFSLPDLNDQLVELTALLDKPAIISVVPDIDTSVCQLQTKRFNQEAATNNDVHFVTISNNTKEQQANWCAAEGVDMTMLRDTDLEFAKNYGLYIPEIGHLARAIFVLDTQGTIVHEEIVPEIATEPDYQKALAAAKALV